MIYFTVRYRVHAIERMFERDISEENVLAILSSGTIIREYPDDKPYPSKLFSGKVNGRPIHVVAAVVTEGKEYIIITVYEPDPARWKL